MKPRAMAAASLLLLALGACDALTDPGPDPPATTTPADSPAATGAGQPPVVHIGGTLDAIDDAGLSVTQPDGAVLRLRRLAGDATRFLFPDGDGYRELAAAEVAGIEAGTRACVEALLDGQIVLAIRVFLDSGCGPLR